MNWPPCPRWTSSARRVRADPVPGEVSPVYGLVTAALACAALWAYTGWPAVALVVAGVWLTALWCARHHRRRVAA